MRSSGPTRLSPARSPARQEVSGGPVTSVERGIGLVPENRKTQGLALVHSVQDNMLLAGLRATFRAARYRRGTAVRLATGLIEQLRVATPSPNRATKFLSGGNQQKVVIGKWIGAGSRLYIFDEPTRGIDVGAKAEIYGLLEQLVAKGARC